VLSGSVEGGGLQDLSFQDDLLREILLPVFDRCSVNRQSRLIGLTSLCLLAHSAVLKQCSASNAQSNSPG